MMGRPWLLHHMLWRLLPERAYRQGLLRQGSGVQAA